MRTRRGRGNRVGSLRAMNGTSTPRQIASRVQKYFEQLMFGVEGSCDIFSSLLVQSTSIPRIQKIDLKFPRPAHKNRHRSLGPDLVSFPSVVVVGPTDRRRFKIQCRTTTRTSGAFGRQNHPSSHSVTNGNTFTGTAKYANSTLWTFRCAKRCFRPSTTDQSDATTLPFR